METTDDADFGREFVQARDEYIRIMQCLDEHYAALTSTFGGTQLFTEERDWENNICSILMNAAAERDSLKNLFARFQYDCCPLERLLAEQFGREGLNRFYESPIIQTYIRAINEEEDGRLAVYSFKLLLAHARLLALAAERRELEAMDKPSADLLESFGKAAKFRDNEFRRVENVRIINLFENIRQGSEVKSAIGDAYPLDAEDYEERFTAYELDDFVEFCGFGAVKTGTVPEVDNVIVLFPGNTPRPQ